MNYPVVRMKSNKNVLEFEVLGFKVKFKPEGEDQLVSAREVVEHVNWEANKLSKSYPQLSSGEIATLVALDFSRRNIELEKEYKMNIEQLNKSAHAALDLVETISPPTP